MTEPLFESDQPLPAAESNARSRLSEWVRCYEEDEWDGELSPDLFAMEFFNAADAVCNRDGTLHLAHPGHSHWADDDEVVRFIDWLETVDAI